MRNVYTSIVINLTDIYIIIHLSNFNKKYHFGTKMDSTVKEKSHTGSFVKQNEQFVFVVFAITISLDISGIACYNQKAIPKQ